jgi:hypothetical protein
LKSSNPVYQKLGEIIVIPKDYDTVNKLVKEGIQGENTHVYLGWLSSSFFDGKFHKSNQVLEGNYPFTVDILNKKWSLAEEYSYHLLVIQQVNNIFRLPLIFVKVILKN